MKFKHFIRSAGWGILAIGETGVEGVLGSSVLSPVGQASGWDAVSYRTGDANHG